MKNFEIRNPNKILPKLQYTAPGKQGEHPLVFQVCILGLFIFSVCSYFGFGLSFCGAHPKVPKSGILQFC